MITMDIVSFVYEYVHNLSPALFSLELQIFIVSAPKNPKEAICLLLVAIQLNMDFDLSITQMFRFWNSLPTDIHNSVSMSIFRSKLNLIFYQIISQFDTYIYIYMYILINALICEILLTYFYPFCTECINFLYPFHFYFPCFDLLD